MEHNVFSRPGGGSWGGRPKQTEAPTTSPIATPTTAEPSAAPTTAEPTVAPTTAAPTVAPTTAEPTAAPTTPQPNTSSPTTTETIPTSSPTTIEHAATSLTTPQNTPSPTTGPPTEPRTPTTPPVTKPATQGDTESPTATPTSSLNVSGNEGGSGPTCAAQDFTTDEGAGNYFWGGGDGDVVSVEVAFTYQVQTTLDVTGQILNDDLLIILERTLSEQLFGELFQESACQSLSSSDATQRQEQQGWRRRLYRRQHRQQQRTARVPLLLKDGKYEQRNAADRLQVSSHGVNDNLDHSDSRPRDLEAQGSGDVVLSIVGMTTSPSDRILPGYEGVKCRTSYVPGASRCFIVGGAYTLSGTSLDDIEQYVPVALDKTQEIIDRRSGDGSSLRRGRNLRIDRRRANGGTDSITLNEVMAKHGVVDVRYLEQIDIYEYDPRVYNLTTDSPSGTTREWDDDGGNPIPAWSILLACAAFVLFIALLAWWRKRNSDNWWFSEYYQRRNPRDAMYNTDKIDLKPSTDPYGGLSSDDDMDEWSSNAGGSATLGIRMFRRSGRYSGYHDLDTSADGAGGSKTSSSCTAPLWRRMLLGSPKSTDSSEGNFPTLGASRSSTPDKISGSPDSPILAVGRFLTQYGPPSCKHRLDAQEQDRDILQEPARPIMQLSLPDYSSGDDDEDVAVIQFRHKGTIEPILLSNTGSSGDPPYFFDDDVDEDISDSGTSASGYIV